MNHEPTTTQHSTGSDASQAAVPMWLIALMAVLLLLGALYFDWNGGWFNSNIYAPYHNLAELERYQIPSSGNEAVILGKRLFEANCALCHNTDGLGKPGQAPPLAGSEWVNAATGYRIIHIPQVGLAGQITVKGQDWSLAMPAMGAAYTSEELSAVLTYIRQAWGNKGAPISPEQVQKVRTEVTGRTQPYSSDELKKMPE